MATKYDIKAWQNGIAQHTQRKADCYKRLAVFQQRGDCVKCEQVYAHIARHNDIIDQLNFQLSQALRVEALV